jgi:hypothetical protein
MRLLLGMKTQLAFETAKTAMTVVPKWPLVFEYQPEEDLLHSELTPPFRSFGRPGQSKRSQPRSKEGKRKQRRSKN